MAKKLGTYYTCELPDGRFVMIRGTQESMVHRIIVGTIKGFKKTFLTKKEAKEKFDEGKPILIGYQTTKYQSFFKVREGETFEEFDARVRNTLGNCRGIKYKEPLPTRVFSILD